jgi:hypothetical protein
MDEVKINTSKTLTLTLPSDPASNTVSVSLYHEFGDLVSGPTNATRVSAGVYTIAYGQLSSGKYILNASGKHRADYVYTISGTEYTQSQYINVYTPYLTSDDFFTEYPELEEEFGAKFDTFAKKAKNIIDTYCGQSFEFYPDKTIYMNGNGYKTMRLPLPITTLSEVVQDEGEDNELVLLSATADSIEKIRQPFNFETTYGIRFKKVTLAEEIFLLGKFHPDSVYKINGDYGWPFVPDNIKQAAILLIADMMNNDNEYRNHNIYRVEMGPTRFYMKESFYDSTGNVEADMLLMDYTLFVMDYIV